MTHDSFDSLSRHGNQQFQASDQFLVEGDSTRQSGSWGEGEQDASLAIGEFSLAMRQLFQAPEREHG